MGGRDFAPFPYTLKFLNSSDDRASMCPFHLRDSSVPGIGRRDRGRGVMEVIGLEKARFGNKEVTFGWKRGEVVKNRRWESITISGSSYVSGMATSPGMGVVQGRGEVHSITTEKHEIWLQAPGEPEWCYEANDLNLKYHEGHILEFLYGQRGKKPRLLQISNRSTGHYVRWYSDIRKLIHRGGGGALRVIAALVLVVWLLPYMAEQRAARLTAEVSDRVNAANAENQRQFQSDMKAAGNNRALRAQASQEFLDRANQMSKRATQLYESADTLETFCASSQYDWLAFLFVVVVFTHAVWTHYRPAHFGEIRAMIDAMDERRASAEQPAIALRA